MDSPYLAQAIQQIRGSVAPAVGPQVNPLAAALMGGGKQLDPNGNRTGPLSPLTSYLGGLLGLGASGGQMPGGTAGPIKGADQFGNGGIF